MIPFCDDVEVQLYDGMCVQACSRYSEQDPFHVQSNFFFALKKWWNVPTFLSLKDQNTAIFLLDTALKLAGPLTRSVIPFQDMLATKQGSCRTASFMVSSNEMVWVWEWAVRWSLPVPPLLVGSRDKLLHSKRRQQTAGWYDNSVSDRKYYRRSIIFYFDWKCSYTVGDSKVNYNAAESLEWNWVEGDYLVPFSNWYRLLNLFFKITNELTGMKESISCRSVQLLSSFSTGGGRKDHILLVSVKLWTVLLAFLF